MPATGGNPCISLDEIMGKVLVKSVKTYKFENCLPFLSFYTNDDFGD